MYNKEIFIVECLGLNEIIEFQKFLFSLGLSWYDDSKEIRLLDENYVIIVVFIKENIFTYSDSIDIIETLKDQFQLNKIDNKIYKLEDKNIIKNIIKNNSNKIPTYKAKTLIIEKLNIDEIEYFKKYINLPIIISKSESFDINKKNIKLIFDYLIKNNLIGLNEIIIVDDIIDDIIFSMYEKNIDYYIRLFKYNNKLDYSYGSMNLFDVYVIDYKIIYSINDIKNGTLDKIFGIQTIPTYKPKTLIREDINDMLENFVIKVENNDENIKIQTLLFKYGHQWVTQRKSIFYFSIYPVYIFVYIKNKNTLSYLGDNNLDYINIYLYNDNKVYKPVFTIYDYWNIELILKNKKITPIPSYKPKKLMFE
jgi:hypothetical protein